MVMKTTVTASHKGMWSRALTFVWLCDNSQRSFSAGGVAGLSLEFHALISFFNLLQKHRHIKWGQTMAMLPYNPFKLITYFLRLHLDTYHWGRQKYELND